MNLPYYHEELSNVIDFTVAKHRNQYRKNKIDGIAIPYLFHPFEVTKYVFKWGAGTLVNLKSSITHDVREDCDVSYEEMAFVVGKESADIVEELSFIPDSNLSKSVIARFKQEYIASFISKSVSALIIKLADRICNSLDFKISDPEYALIYWHKADLLFDIYNQRRGEVVSLYGEKTAFNIDETIAKTLAELKM